MEPEDLLLSPKKPNARLHPELAQSSLETISP